MAVEGALVDPASLEEELVKLQTSLFLQDFFSTPRACGIHYLSCRHMNNIRLRMGSHEAPGRPHLYVDYGQQRRSATYAIDTGERLAGELDKKYDSRVASWIEDCRPTLLQAWSQLQIGRSADELTWELQGAE